MRAMIKDRSFSWGSVCSGIGCGDLAVANLGGKHAWFAEVAPFPSQVLAARFGASAPERLPDPDIADLSDGDRKLRRLAIQAVKSARWPVNPKVRNLGDMSGVAAMILAGEVSAPDGMIGGCPCQSFSVAGLRQGLTDDRGNLTLQYVRIADAIDAVRLGRGEAPAFFLYENVPGILSMRDNAFGSFLAGMVGGDEALQPPEGRSWPDAGVVHGPTRVAAWRVLDAQHFGLAQRRRRIFVLSHGGADQWQAADALLPIIESVRWHPAPRRGQAPSVAALTAAGVGTCGPDDNQAQAGHLIAGTLLNNGKTAANATTQDAANGLLVACAVNVPDTATTLRSRDCKGSPDSDATQTLIVTDDQTVGTLPGNSPGLGWRIGADEAAAGHVVPVAVDIRNGSIDPGTTMSVQAGGQGVERGICINALPHVMQCITGDITHTLTTRCGGRKASEDGTGRGTPMVPVISPVTMGPCAKKQVRCTLLCGNGNRYVGTNDCANPQQTCPRLPGEGYEKCKSICAQPHHAEVGALKAAGPAARGALAFIEGIGHVCDDCQEKLDEAGVTGWSLQAPPSTSPIAFHPLQDPISSQDISHALGQGSSNGGQCSVAIAFMAKDYGGDAGLLSPTLRAMNFDGSHANGGGQVAVALPFDTTQMTSGVNRSNPKPGDPCHPLAAGAHPPAVALQPSLAVRRLMPVECERLQGLPDGWTDIPTKRAKSRKEDQEDERIVEIDGQLWKMAADGPRYQSIGNGMAVPVIEYIIAQVMRVTGRSEI